MQKVAILGYGRFGKALADLILNPRLHRPTPGAAPPTGEPRFEVAALDPLAPVPDTLRAESLDALLGGASFLVLAVPVSKVRATLDEIAQRVPADPSRFPLVVDVGSVKRGPVQALEEILGERARWVATHPLFGPSSILLGERPLRVVVCPNERHPGAAGEARSFFDELGCEVIEQSADEHDQVMARTHALAFFLAKGLLDVGADESLSFSPPSFRAMARTVEAVRSDAGHLFLAIQNENPYAASAREDLLQALSTIHRSLETARESPEEDPSPAPAPLAIPDLGDRAFELRETRDLIDEVDGKIVRLLAQRAELSRRAGRIKSQARRAVTDPQRESELLRSRSRWADDLGLDPTWIQEVFRSLLRYSRSLQDEPGSSSGKA